MLTVIKCENCEYFRTKEGDKCETCVKESNFKYQMEYNGIKAESIFNQIQATMFNNKGNNNKSISIH